MARKKHLLEDNGGFSSSDDDEPHRDDERSKGRRKRTKDESIYGSFYDWGSEDEGSTSKSGGGSRSQARKRAGFAFVPAASTSTQQKKQSSTLARDSGDEDMNDESDADDDDNDSRDGMDVDNASDDGDEDDEDEDDQESRRAREAAFRAQRQRDQDEVDAYEDRVQRPQMGAKQGIGLGGASASLHEQDSPMDSPSSPNSTPSRNKAMAASIRAGLGLSADTGASTPTDGTPRRSTHHGSMSFFKNRVGLAEAGSAPGSPSPRPSSPASISSPRRDVPMVAPVKVDKDYGAFSAKGSGFGLKMLEKMGWKKGYGLGAGGSGIVEPIQTKLRPVKMGIGFKGFKEKTDQTVAEEKRRGVVHSSDEDEKATKKASKDDRKEQPKADGWKKSSSQGSRKAPKVEYKTAEEIQLEIESADMPMAAAQPQKILDMTGKTVRELTSASQIRSTIPFEHELFPELRHNTQLMADISTTDLEQLARSQKNDHVRQKVLEAESERMQKLVAQDVLNIERMDNVLAITDKCCQIADEIRQATSDTTGAASVEIKEDYIITAFQEPFDLLSGLYFAEYQLYQLDQLVIAVIQDSFKALLRDWDVLKNPTLGAGLFQRWRKLLRQSKVLYSDNGVAARFFGSRPPEPEPMTAYESLLNHQWLPKVRSALNNEWNPRDCDPVIRLLEAWSSPLLPAFIHDNIITQLIIPKLKREVEQWTARDPVMLHTWIHPWLPVLEESRLEQELYGDIRRKLANGLSGWNILDPSGLHVVGRWKGVFNDTDMEALLQKSVLPKLVEGLQMLEINPRNQQMEIFMAVLQWHEVFPTATFSSLMWHQVLQLWLAHPSTTDMEQVFQWYQWWKSQFPPELVQDTGIAAAFRQGLDMINQGLN
ncbi:MAG: GC-rich sequence DNA-binding factor-like protein-domain-containing protein [Benniella sp.]|nr:MAG: GC-rich sequence DNA-binding factor-like protein-domain-containing protein [Benniella sp.]